MSIPQLATLFRTEPYEPITLRAIRMPLLPTRNLTYTAHDFPDIDARWAALMEDAASLNEQGYNIYTCLNPISPAFEGNRTNGLAVGDDDIARRRLLLIDLDRAYTAKEPATDDEVNAAHDLSLEIESFLSEQGHQLHARVMSGNGVHLYYPFDLPNCEEARDQCKMLLKGLGLKFDTAQIKIDKVVSNASRITKLPGTIAYKGFQSEDRPYRKAVIL